MLVLTAAISNHLPDGIVKLLAVGLAVTEWVG